MSWIAAQWHALADQGWPAVILVGIVSCSICFGSIAIIFLAVSKAREGITKLSVKDEISSRPSKSDYISEMNIYAGSVAVRMFPSFTIKFAQNCEKGRVLVDYSAILEGGGSTVRKTIVLRELPLYSRGEQFTRPLISAEDIESEDWFWGGDELSPKRGAAYFNIGPDGNLTPTSPNSKDQLMRRCKYKGRLIFQDPIGREHHCYFIIMQSDIASKQLPTVISNECFNFISEWGTSDIIPG